MAVGVLIIGDSGTGKSTSLRNLDPESTVIIKAYNKDLPFRTANYPKKHIMAIDKPGDIVGICKSISKDAPHIKRIIIDDLQYMSATPYMNRIKEKGYEKFNDIGKGLWDVATVYPQLRDDIVVYLINHEDINVDASGVTTRRAKTYGKLFNDKVTFEGLYTIVLFTEVTRTGDKIEYNFMTNNPGNTTGKTPMGMFEELYIPNDLNEVEKAIREYYLI